MNRTRAGQWSALAVQPSLDHRGVFGSGDAPLFPPAGTLEALGGREAVARLIDGLYERIETDAILRPAFFPDLAEEREIVKLFFEAWFGGLPAYFDAEWRHGLRAAHTGISISRGMADRWVGHFFDSFAETIEDPTVAVRIRPSITRLANALVNRSEEPAAGERLHGSRSGESDIRPFMPHIQRDDASGIAAAAAAHPRVIQRHGPVLLLIAAVRGKAEVAAELLRLGVDVNAPRLLPGSEASAHDLPRLLITPLCGALIQRREAVVRLLVQQGAQYDIFTAACVGDLDAVRELLDLAPALVDARDPACDVAPITPLMHAVCAGQFEVTQLLLQRGATVGANSVRLVRSAANAGQEALTDLLLEHGADPAMIGAGHWVTYPAIAGKLLDRGANVNLEPGAWIGLCCTGNSGHRENVPLVRAMLRCGADVTARYKGRTALHCAAQAGFANVVAVLIEHGADVNALDARSQTPLDAAMDAAGKVDRGPVQRHLIAHGARRSQYKVK
ncbi:MAG TPA: ankyrin repeat domain-containing protein [Armatimonadota bacterium]